MRVGDYELVNDEKLDRAINGTIGKGGAMTGGVGQGAADGAILAEYDRLGGLIQKNGLKVATGAFWDCEKKKPAENPNPVFEVVVEGSIVDVTESEAAALDTAKKKRDELKAEAKEKKKGKRVLRRAEDDEVSE